MITFSSVFLSLYTTFTLCLPAETLNIEEPKSPISLLYSLSIYTLHEVIAETKTYPCNTLFSNKTLFSGLPARYIGANNYPYSPGNCFSLVSKKTS